MACSGLFSPWVLRGCDLGVGSVYASPDRNQSSYTRRRPMPYLDSSNADAWARVSPRAFIKRTSPSRSPAAGSTAPGASAAPSMTRTISPRGSAKCASASAAVPTKVSSCSFVSSRHTAMRAVAQASRRWPPASRAGAAATRRRRASRGASRASSSRRRSVAGRARQEADEAEASAPRSPATDSAAIGADGPGTATTS